MSISSVVLVYNKSAGGQYSAEALHQLFDDCGITIEETIALDKGFEKQLEQSIKSKPRVVAAVGGDGTLSAVAGILADTESVLLPLPGGTLNNFTKDLGVPQDIKDALYSAIKKQPQKVDLGEVNGVCFINNSSLGLYPLAVRSREKTEHIIGKWPAAIIGAIGAYIRFRTYTVTVDGESFETPFIFVGNNDYQIDQVFDWKRETLNAGTLSVYMAKTTSRFGFARACLRVLRSKHITMESFERRKSAALTIESRKHRRVHISRDGEVEMLQTPLSYRSRKASLRVLA